MKKAIIINVFILVLTACKTTENITKLSVSDKVNYSAQISISKGGIVENTNMDELSGVSVDAFSGATKNGLGAGGRISYPFSFLSLETGLDYQLSNQSFLFSDPANKFYGNRNLTTHQFMMPLSLNVRLFTRKNHMGLAQIKLGHLLQFNHIIAGKESGILPNYNIHRWSNGLLMGIHFTPFELKKGNKAGAFIEIYRGSQIYEDHYNQKHFDMPGSAFNRIGVIYHF